MKHSRRARWAAAAALGAGLVLSVSGQAGPSLRDVLAGNVRSAGGRAALDGVRNLSFEAGGERYVVSTTGKLKVLTGKAPVVTEVVLATTGEVRRNAYGTIGEVTGPQKAVYEVLAGLYAGLFSLEKFEGRLELKGLEAFGPERLYHLACSAKLAGCDVDFFLRPDDFRLKRLVVRGSTPEGDVFEVNTDYPPFEDVDGLSMPTSWFVSQVGTRGTLVEVTNVKTNLPLDGDFFATLDVNIGTTRARPGFMSGNVLNVSRSRGGTIVVTNWTGRDVAAAGFKTGDELTLTLGGPDSGRTATAVFYAEAGEVPPADGPQGAGCILAPAPRGGQTYIIRPGGPGGSEFAGSAEAMMPLTAEKKRN